LADGDSLTWQTFDDAVERTSRWEVLLLLSIPVVLGGLMTLSPSQRANLSLSPQASGWMLYIPHFIHESWMHLFSNLVSYTALVLFLFPLVAATERRRWFYTALALCLTLVPFAVSIGFQANSFPANGQGFSAIMSAWYVYVPIGLSDYLHYHVSDVYSRWDAVGFLGVGFLLLYVGGFRLIWVAALGGAGVLLWLQTLRKIDREHLQRLRHSGSGLIAAFVLLIWTAGILTGVRYGNGFVHVLGMTYGLMFIVPSCLLFPAALAVVKQQSVISSRSD